MYDVSPTGKVLVAALFDVQVRVKLLCMNSSCDRCLVWMLLVLQPGDTLTGYLLTRAAFPVSYLICPATPWVSPCAVMQSLRRLPRHAARIHRGKQFNHAMYLCLMAHDIVKFYHTYTSF